MPQAQPELPVQRVLRALLVQRVLPELLVLPAQHGALLQTILMQMVRKVLSQHFHKPVLLQMLPGLWALLLELQIILLLPAFWVHPVTSIWTLLQTVRFAGV